jgi:hypothetical protein
MAQLAPPVGSDPTAALVLSGLLRPRASLRSVHALSLLAPPPFARVATVAPARNREDGGTPPACVDDVCQPRVSVPGYDPVVSTKGKRTELFLSFLDRIRFEPIASIAWALASTGVRVDYAPPRLEGDLVQGQRGWGRFQVFLKFRIDAANGPVWMTRPGR